MQLATSRRFRRYYGLLAALLLALAISPTAAAAQPANTSARTLGLDPLAAPLIKPDTVLHALGGMMAGFLAASAAAGLYGRDTVRSYPILLPAVGLSAAVVAGIGKETLDSTGFGDPQWSDIVHTVIGGSLTAGIIAAVELTSGGGQRSFQTEAALFGSLGVSISVPVGAAFLNEILLYLHRRKSKK